MRASVLLVLLTLVGAGCSGSSQTCGMDGVTCTSTEDCCYGLFCVSGVCSTSCGMDSETCTSMGDCCSGLSCASGVCSMCSVAGASCASRPCCSGSTCEPDKLCYPAGCLDEGEYCDVDAEPCCQSLSCTREGHTCAPGNIGDPCTEGSNCMAGLTCVGWCTKPCASDAECTTSTGANVCIQSSEGTICYPVCAPSMSDCDIYGSAGGMCSTGYNPMGTGYPVCGS